MEDKPKAIDLLGLKPYGEAIKIAVERGFDGASALLSRVCLPAAEEQHIVIVYHTIVYLNRDRR